VGVRWYAVALLTAPLLMTAILFALSLASQTFLPGIVTAEDKAGLLVGALVAGLVAGFFEEIGWTGFATHELRKRHGVLATGLIVGLLWGVWHAPIYLSTDSGAVPLALYVPVMAFSILVPYRVLMVWVYDRTQSVLVAMLMHLMIVACAFVLASSTTVGVPDLIFNLVVGATLWVLVSAAAAADRRKRSRPKSDGPSTAAKYRSEHAA
jgi:membrane protease YdiL (CAAX protease family)